MKAAENYASTYDSLGKIQSNTEKAARGLMDVIRAINIDHEEDVELLIYFDEAHTLANSTVKSTTKMDMRNRYHALCSAFSKSVDLPFFAIMMSTNSNLAKLAPSQLVYPSLRVLQVAEDSLQPPFTELPFDCLEDDKPIFSLGTTRVDVCEVEFMMKFGRPL